MIEIEVGSVVEHVLTRDWFLVLEVKDDFYTCRAKNYSVHIFGKSEIKKIK